MCVAVHKQSNDIAGAYRHCPAGLSETCQHVAWLLFTLREKENDSISSTDVLCSWIEPPEAKRTDPPVPFKDIPFRKLTINGPTPNVKRKRVYSPCDAVAAGTEDLVSGLKATFLRYIGQSYISAAAYNGLAGTNTEHKAVSGVQSASQLQPACTPESIISDSDSFWSEVPHTG